MSQKQRVIVVGSGIAGLGCCRRLIEANPAVEITVLEAENRLGGRLCSGEVGDKEVNVGASWIHGVEGNPVMEMLESIGGKEVDIVGCERYMEQFKVKNGPDGVEFDGSRQRELIVLDIDGQCSKDGLIFLPDGTPASPESMQTAMSILFEIMDGIAAMPDRASVSLTTAISRFLSQNSQLVNELLTQEYLLHIVHWMIAGIAQYEASSCRELSAEMALIHSSDPDTDPTKKEVDTYLIESEFSGGDKIVRSYSLLIDLWFDRLKKSGQIEIKTGEEVTQIERSTDGSVEVTTKKGERYRADYCVCTVSLGVLKAETLRFQPQISVEKQQAIKTIGFGLMNKVILEFPSVFWDPDASWFGLVSHNLPEDSELTDTKELSSFICSPLAFCYCVNMLPVLKKPVLMVFLTGDCAKEFSPLNRDPSQTVEEWDQKVVLDRLMQILSRCNFVQADKQKPVAERQQQTAQRKASDKSEVGAVPWPIATHFTHWEMQEHFRGSYSFQPPILPGYVDKVIAQMAQSEWDRRLHFAGEHACGSWKHIGYAHGALMSGERAAKEILQSIQQSAAPVAKL